MKKPFIFESPDSQSIKKARYYVGHTQRQAADFVHSTLRTWQAWEYGDRKMHPVIWHFYVTKNGLDYVDFDKIF